MRNKFDAPWAAMLWIISIFSSIVIFALPLTLFRNMNMQVLNILVPLFFVVWFGSMLFMVRSYRLEKKTLFIRRFLWESKVDLSELTEAEVLPPGSSGAQIRLFGNGGLFSFSGWYWSSKLGVYRMWVTDPKRQVLLRFQSRKVVVSPDSPEEFVRSVKQATR